MTTLRQMLGTALVDRLNEQSWSVGAIAARGWRPVADPADTAEAALTVVVGRKVSGQLDRASKRHTLTVSIVVQRQHGGPSGEDDPVEHDDKIEELAEEVADFLGAMADGVALADGRFAEQIGDIESEVSDDRPADGVMAVILTLQYLVFE